MPEKGVAFYSAVCLFCHQLHNDVKGVSHFLVNILCICIKTRGAFLESSGSYMAISTSKGT